MLKNSVKTSLYLLFHPHNLLSVYIEQILAWWENAVNTFKKSVPKDSQQKNSRLFLLENVWENLWNSLNKLRKEKHWGLGRTDLVGVHQAEVFGFSMCLEQLKVAGSLVGSVIWLKWRLMGPHYIKLKR